MERIGIKLEIRLFSTEDCDKNIDFKTLSQNEKKEIANYLKNKIREAPEFFSEVKNDESIVRRYFSNIIVTNLEDYETIMYLDVDKKIINEDFRDNLEKDLEEEVNEGYFSDEELYGIFPNAAIAFQYKLL